MTPTNYRREFWQTIYAAYVNASNTINEDSGARWADKALKALDERFPSSHLEDEEVIKMLDSDNKRLQGIIDQLGAQVTELRHVAPARDVEIERLTREGLIKDQKLGVINEDFNNLLGAYNEKVVHISELKEEIELHKINAKTLCDKLDERDSRIKDLEAEIYNNNTTVVPKYATEPGDDTLNSEGVNIPKQPTIVKDWLELLEEPYRSQALKNINIFAARDKCSSRAEALHKGFSWEISPEGYDYWLNVVFKVQKSEQPTTVKEWLETLEEPYRSQALANAEEQRKALGWQLILSHGTGPRKTGFTGGNYLTNIPLTALYLLCLTEYPDDF